ncbi:MAG: fructose-bisphosphate aldolase, class I [Microgenomates group bacterium Gr01-1014_7]|nr:MAG: fructose-bisphosphate aldolase, class I [Microgenomates group bacterium Gr01-1014_7]
MDINILKQTVQALLAPTKGILAADESSGTIKKRFEKIGLESSPDTNLAYRKMLFTTPGIEEYLSGIILFDETIRQSIDGKSVSEYLESKGIIPGIKVDKGAVDLPNFPDEKITEGLDGLKARLEEYAGMGAKFAKWRAVIKIGEGIPTDTCLYSNAEVLARYAAITQNAGLVPIIEPEVIRDGSHDLKKDAEVTAEALKAVFERIAAHKIALEGLILKTNMVTAGEDNPNQASPDEVAKATIDAFLESVPKELPGIVFLSGGQPPEMATDNLNTISKIGGPWELSFSFARALQGEAMELWAGKDENLESAQKAFLERAKKVSLARAGKL